MIRSSKKADYMWNTMAGIINALEAVVMSVVASHFVELSSVGELLYAFALSNLFLNIGKFGVRSFQVTDIDNKYSFKDYLLFRCITTTVMIGIALIYVWCTAKSYSAEKIKVVLLIISIYAVESVEDVLWGEFQLKGYLHCGAKMFFWRWIAILTSFSATIIFFNDIVLALQIALSFSIFVFFIFSLSLRKIYTGNKQPFSLKQIQRLALETLPLALSAFIYTFFNNMCKYVLNAKGTDELQACYGFIAMPIFAIALLNNLIYYPLLVEMANNLNNKEIDQFLSKYKKQIIIIAVLTVCVTIIGFIAGIPCLSLLYNTNLAKYKVEFMILIVSSGILAWSGYTSTILVMMRKQFVMIFTQGLVSTVAYAIMFFAFDDYGIRGICIGYSVANILLGLVYYIVFIVNIQSVKGKKVHFI